MLGCMVQEIPCVHCLKANTECRECAYSHGNDAWRRVMRVMKGMRGIKVAMLTSS